MNEESSALGSIAALSSMDDYASAQDNSAALQPAAPSVSLSAVSTGTPRPTAQAVQSAVDQINAYLSGVDRVLSLKVDPGSGYTVATISDAQTGQVLQQMPTEDHIQLERMLARWSHGGNVLMDVEA